VVSEIFAIRNCFLSTNSIESEERYLFRRLAAWSEFLFALTFTDERTQTVPVVISQFSGVDPREFPWGEIMAASMVVTVPLVILVLMFQYRIVKGLTAGAVKG